MGGFFTAPTTPTLELVAQSQPEEDPSKRQNELSDNENHQRDDHQEEEEDRRRQIAVIMVAVLLYGLTLVHWRWFSDKRDDHPGGYYDIYLCTSQLGFCFDKVEMVLAVNGTLFLLWGINMFVKANHEHSYLYKHFADDHDTALPRENFAGIFTHTRPDEMDSRRRRCNKPRTQKQRHDNHKKGVGRTLRVGGDEMDSPPTLLDGPLKLIDLRMLFLVVCVVVNVISVFLAIPLMPDKINDRPLNFPRHIVACVELYYVTWNVVAFVGVSRYPGHFYAPVKIIADRLTMAATFSCLRFLPEMNVLQLKVSLERAKGNGKRAVMLVRFALFGMFAMMSLVIKAESVHYLHTKTSFLYWTPMQIFRMAAFMNSIVGVFHKQAFAVRMLLKGMDEDPKSWMEVCAEHIRQNAFAEEYPKVWEEYIPAVHSSEDEVTSVLNAGPRSCRAWWRAVGYFSTLTHREVFLVQEMLKETFRSNQGLPDNGVLIKEFTKRCTIVRASHVKHGQRQHKSFIAWIFSAGYIEELEHPLRL